MCPKVIYACASSFYIAHAINVYLLRYKYAKSWVRDVNWDVKITIGMVYAQTSVDISQVQDKFMS